MLPIQYIYIHITCYLHTLTCYIHSYNSYTYMYIHVCAYLLSLHPCMRGRTYVSMCTYTYVCVRPITCNYTQYVYMYIHTYLHSTKSTCYDLKEVKAEGIKLAWSGQLTMSLPRMVFDPSEYPELCRHGKTRGSRADQSCPQWLSGLRERCGLTVDYSRDYSTFEV